MIPTLERCLEERKPDLLAFVQQLIQADTTTLGHGILGGYERLGQDVILARLKAMDCDRIDVWEPDNQLLESSFLGASQGDNWLRDHPPELLKYQEGSPFFFDPEHVLIQTLRSQITGGTGGDPEVRGSFSGCDARLLNNRGQTPTVIFGPGFPAQAHAIDESLDLDQFYTSIDILARLIVAWAG